MYANLRDDLGIWLAIAHDAAQTNHANQLTSAVEPSRLERAQTEQYAYQLAELVRLAAKDHRGWLISHKLRAPRGQCICELHYAINGDSHPDRGVRFQIDIEAGMLSVWWLPLFALNADTPGTRVVIVGGVHPDAALTALVSQIDLTATVALTLQTMISSNLNWSHGQRPLLSPLSGSTASPVGAEPVSASARTVADRFGRFRRKSSAG